MKSLATSLAFTFAFATPAFAAKMVLVSKAANPTVEAIYSSVQAEWNKRGNCMEATLVKVLKRSNANGRTEAELLSAMTRESIHRFVTQWFDESIDLNITTSKDDLDKFFNDTQLEVIEENEPQFKLTLVREKLVTLTSDPSVVVYAGYGSGNNTAGEILAVYDKKNDQILSLVYSNFASDSDCGD